MKRIYLILAAIALCVTFVLNKMGSQIKWITLGFGLVMLVLSFIYRKKIKQIEEETTEGINNLNKIGGQKDGI